MVSIESQKLYLHQNYGNISFQKPNKPNPNNAVENNITILGYHPFFWKECTNKNTITPIIEMVKNMGKVILGILMARSKKKAHIKKVKRLDHILGSGQMAV